MPKPVPNLTVPRIGEVNNGPLPQEEVPQTPATPVSAEGLVSLQNLIIRQDAHALEEASKRRLRRHLDKFAKAAHLSFAKGALQQHHIRLLLKINDEAKVRRTTKSLVLGKAKVMSFEDLVEARAKRAEKDARKIAKKQRRKRSGGQEVVPDATFQVPLAAATESANGHLWMAEAQYAVAPVPPCPGAAPTARMW